MRMMVLVVLIVYLVRPSAAQGPVWGFGNSLEYIDYGRGNIPRFIESLGTNNAMVADGYSQLGTSHRLVLTTGGAVYSFGEGGRG